MMAFMTRRLISVLLPVRIPLLGLRHPGHLLLPDQHRHGILPAVRRELPLVVEIILRVRRFSHLRFRLQRLLLLHEAGHRGIRPNPAILHLHAHDGEFTHTKIVQS